MMCALVSCYVFFLTALMNQNNETLFVAEPLTAGIEGPAYDARGNVYGVNFQRQQTIGKVTPQGKGEIFVTLPGNSVGNGI